MNNFINYIARKYVRTYVRTSIEKLFCTMKYKSKWKYDNKMITMNDFVHKLLDDGYVQTYIRTYVCTYVRMYDFMKNYYYLFN